MRSGLVLLCLLLAGPACAQFQLPSLPGTWNPVNGHGALYRIMAPGRDVEHLETSVVGEEGGAPWIELTSDANHTQTIMKLLLTPRGARRVILKMTGKPAVEVPPDSVLGGPPVDVSQVGKKLGQETVTTPAGQFRCDHYKLSTCDAWVAGEVRPYGLVRAQGPGLSILLEKTLTGTHTRITEKPQALEMP